MSYLTQENAQYILQILNRFLTDKYQFKIYDALDEPSIRKLLETYMIQIYRNGDKNLSIEDLNKQTLSILKEYFKKEYVLSQEINIIPTEEGYSSIERSASASLPDDSEFLNKVQRLELQRKTFQIKLPEIKGVNPPAPITITPVPVSVPVPNAITTIYMPTPPKIGTEIFIHSWQREWIYSTQRSSFIWNGPFPKMQDSLIKIACWIGPISILQKAPCLKIQLSGASGPEFQEISLIPSYTCHLFAIYKPALESLGYIRRMSLPWKVILKTMDGQSLDMGEDGEEYERFEASHVPKHTFLYCQHPKNYMIGDTIRIITEKHETITAQITNTNSSSIEVNQPIQTKGFLMNFTQQYSILMELTTSTHTPIQM
uniref:Uncharacterized protein n=1 Tax=viral metagenome TaxID=1070528 RepID=A0A6C0CU19_9ZZZZ